MSITATVPDYGTIENLPDMSIDQLRRVLSQQLGLTQVENAPVSTETDGEITTVTFGRRAGGQKA